MNVDPYTSQLETAATSKGSTTITLTKPLSPPPPAFCKDPKANAKKIFPPRYQPQACFSYQDGKFCPTQQPDWSAYRERSVGFGTLELQSATQAKWTWRKNEWPAWQIADAVTIYRTPNKSGCDNKFG